MNPNIQIESITMAGYLNLISATMKQMQIPQTIDQFVPFDAQCKVTPGEMVQLIIMDMLTGRQAMVHAPPMGGPPGSRKIAASRAGSFVF